MELVKELGLEEQTIFVFTSDNGPLTGNHQGLAGTDCAFFNSNGGLRNGKGSLYEGGVRVPGIVRWKGHVAPGTTSERVTGFEDWMPTLMELTGTPGVAPSPMELPVPMKTVTSPLSRPLIRRATSRGVVASGS